MTAQPRKSLPVTGVGPQVRLVSMGNEGMTIREASAGDFEVLVAAGLGAMNWGGEAKFTLEQFLGTPKLSHYIEGWPREDDFGVIAEADGIPTGAAWCRSFPATGAGESALR